MVIDRHRSGAATRGHAGAAQPGAPSAGTVRFARTGKPDSGAEAPAPLAGVTVLLVDDDALVLKGLELTLQAKGASVLAAKNLEGVAGFLAGADAKPQAVVADYVLGQGEMGTDAIAAARNAGVESAILVTGDTSPDRLAESARGGYRLLLKPVNPNQLVLVLAELLGRRPGRLQ